uniref:Uncharacterized protein n=1 Tax=Anopheles arabiensis TaxID=7173 RepID=A0A182IEX3_ANOAR
MIFKRCFIFWVRDEALYSILLIALHRFSTTESRNVHRIAMRSGKEKSFGNNIRTACPSNPILFTFQP